MSTSLALAVLLLAAAPPAPPSSPTTPPVLPAATPVAPATRLEGHWPAQPSGKRVTFEVHDAHEALKRISAAAGWNLVLKGSIDDDDDIQLSFKDAPVEEALTAVLTAADLAANRIGDTVVVRPSTAAGDADGPDDVRIKVTKDLGTLRSDRGDRVAMGDVNVPAGEHRRDIVAIGGSVHLGQGASARDVVAVGGHVDLDPDAHVERDAVAVGGGVHVSSGARIERDAVAVGGQVHTDPGGSVERDSQDVLSVGGGALKPMLGAGFGMLSPFFLIGSVLARFAAFFCFAAILLLVAPRQLERIAAALEQRPFRAGIAGFLGTLALPVLGLLLVVTIVGWPLIPVEFFGTVLAWVMGFSALAFLLGRRLPLPPAGGELLRLAAGTAIVVVISAIPVLGILAMVTGWFVIFGAVLLTRFGSREDGIPGKEIPADLAVR